jgi:hypothetical protein
MHACMHTCEHKKFPFVFREVAVRCMWVVHVCTHVGMYECETHGRSFFCWSSMYVCIRPVICHRTDSRYVYACLRVWMYVRVYRIDFADYTYIRMHVYTSFYRHLTCVYVYIHACTYACMSACMQSCFFMHTCTYIYTYMSRQIEDHLVLSWYLYIHVHTCTYIYTYTCLAR